MDTSTCVSTARFPCSAPTTSSQELHQPILTSSWRWLGFQKVLCSQLIYRPSLRATWWSQKLWYPICLQWGRFHSWAGILPMPEQSSALRWAFRSEYRWLCSFVRLSLWKRSPAPPCWHRRSFYLSLKGRYTARLLAPQSCSSRRRSHKNLTVAF